MATVPAPGAPGWRSRGKIVRDGRLGLLRSCEDICTSDAVPPTWHVIVSDGLLNVRDGITYRRAGID
jgi:hypothetical protein